MGEGTQPADVQGGTRNALGESKDPRPGMRQVHLRNTQEAGVAGAKPGRAGAGNEVREVMAWCAGGRGWRRGAPSCTHSLAIVKALEGFRERSDTI